MYTIIVCICAGFGAGTVAGLAGISTATVVSPLLIALLGFNAYEALGISLASDVLASGLSAAVYAKRGNVDFRRAMWVLLPAAVFTVLGSLVGYATPNGFLAVVSIGGTIVIGLKFLIKPVPDQNSSLSIVKGEAKMRAGHIVMGVCIGAICGFSGVGGGMMMLLVFTAVLGYDLKRAIGTSIFIMTFIALLGAISHFAFIGQTNIRILLLCMASALVGAFLASKYANYVRGKSLNIAVGVCLTVMGILLFIIHFFI